MKSPSPLRNDDVGEEAQESGRGFEFAKGKGKSSELPPEAEGRALKWYNCPPCGLYLFKPWRWWCMPCEYWVANKADKFHPQCDQHIANFDAWCAVGRPMRWPVDKKGSDFPNMVITNWQPKIDLSDAESPLPDADSEKPPQHPPQQRSSVDNGGSDDGSDGHSVYVEVGSLCTASDEDARSDVTSIGHNSSGYEEELPWAEAQAVKKKVQDEFNPRPKSSALPKKLAESRTRAKVKEELAAKWRLMEKAKRHHQRRDHYGKDGKDGKRHRQRDHDGKGGKDGKRRRRHRC